MGNSKDMQLMEKNKAVLLASHSTGTMCINNSGNGQYYMKLFNW